MTIFLVLGAFFAGVSITAWITGSQLRRLATSNTRLSYRGKMADIAFEEIGRALYSFRDIFDHFGAYVPMDPKLDELLLGVANELPNYARQLANQLERLPVTAESPVERVLPQRLQDGEALDRLVKAINDPVFNALWASRTPSALSELLRHGLFLALGYPNAVAAWHSDGVALELPDMKDPGYPNWGCRTLESVTPARDYMWKKWRDKVSTPEASTRA